MSALNERRPHRLHVGRILVRRGGIVLLAVALVPLSAYLFASGSHHSYIAEAIVVVPSGAGPHDPGNAQEAETLAVTYAAVIPQDDRILNRIARRLRVQRSLVKRELTAVTDQTTSLIHLRFTDDRRNVAVAGARAAAEAVTARVRVTPGIAPRSIALVRFPTTAAASSRPATTVPIGIVLGLVLGLTLLVAWERTDTRTDDVESLEAETGCPSMRLGDLSTGSIIALLQRWEALAERPAPRVALVAAAANAESAAVATAERLRDAARMERIAIAIEDRRAGENRRDGGGDNARKPPHSNELGKPTPGQSGAADRTTLVVGGAPGSDAAGDAAVLDADFVVLVASPGTRASDIRNTVAVLEQFGVPPGWALLSERPRARALRAPRKAPPLTRRRPRLGQVSSGAADRKATKDAAV
jgi:capsular polysaccharide biosynthesis protein